MQRKQIKTNNTMKNNQDLMNEFQIEELENRFEMKKWIEFVECDNPDHCHQQNQ